MADSTTIYPRTKDRQTVYLKNVITNPNIEVGDYTIYNDFFNDPVKFEENNVLYHYPINHDKLTIGKYCSIACGAKFLFNSANHTLSSLSTYPFPLFFEEWELDPKHVTRNWDHKGDIIIGNDVWIGFEAVILAGGDDRRWGNYWCPCCCDKRCVALYYRRKHSSKTNQETV